ncbi:MAG: carbohydrate ABC transporter permease [Hyphomicrobiales bacterium]
MSQPRRQAIGQVPAWIVAFIILVMVAGPMLWAVSTSLKTEVDAVKFPPVLLPSSPTFQAYLDVFTHTTFMIELFNSVLYAAGAVIVSLLVGIPSGYAAARLTFRGKGTLLLVILATSMIPGVALLVPTYYVLDRLGLLNNAIVVVIISATRLLPQTVWFVKDFVDAVPPEIDEAAMVDGASRGQILRKMILPLIRPGIAAIGVLGVISTWNDYITVAVFAPAAESRTLQVALVDQVFDSVGISWSYTLAFAIVASMPIVMLFMLTQRWFIAGLTAGAAKG